MQTIYRYKAQKPVDGHLSWMLHTDAIILSFAESWHSEHGWELTIDVQENTERPKERRWFFLCNAGDNLDFIGDNADLFHVGTHVAKSYASFLYETSHLSETQRELGHVQPSRYVRNKPDYDELSRRQREIIRREKSQDRRRPSAPAPAVSTNGDQPDAADVQVEP